MAIVKRSNAYINSVYENKNDVLEEIAMRSLCCLKCGKKLPQDDSIIVICDSCGGKTPRVFSSKSKGD